MSRLARSFDISMVDSLSKLCPSWTSSQVGKIVKNPHEKFLKYIHPDTNIPREYRGIPYTSSWMFTYKYDFSQRLFESQKPGLRTGERLNVQQLEGNVSFRLERDDKREACACAVVS